MDQWNMVDVVNEVLMSIWEIQNFYSLIHWFPQKLTFSYVFCIWWSFLIWMCEVFIPQWRLGKIFQNMKILATIIMKEAASIGRNIFTGNVPAAEVYVGTSKRRRRTTISSGMWRTGRPFVSGCSLVAHANS